MNIPKMPLINSPLRLKESKISKPSDFIDWIIEYFLFFRWIYFKNRPRTNLLLIRTCMSISVGAVIYYLIFSSFNLLILGIDIEPFLAVVIAISIGFWSTTNVFNQKNNFISNRYADILKALGNKNYETAELLANSLSMNLVAMDLWAHRSFMLVFESAIRRAIFYAVNEKKTELSFEAYLEKLNSGKVRIDEALKLLQEYQYFLIHKDIKE